MSKAKSGNSGRTFTIVSSMKANGSMTVRDATTGMTYEIVDYVDDLLQKRMADLPKGGTVTLELVPIADCTGICQVTRLSPGGLPQPGATMSLE